MFDESKDFKDENQRSSRRHRRDDSVLKDDTKRESRRSSRRESKRKSETKHRTKPSHDLDEDEGAMRSKSYSKFIKVEDIRRATDAAKQKSTALQQNFLQRLQK